MAGRKRKPQYIPRARYGDPTPERRQHGALREVETIDAGITAWQAECPLKLDAYHDDKRITDVQHQAGEQYRSMGLDCGKLDKGAFRWGAVGGIGEISDEFALAERAFRDAARAVGSYIMATDALCLYDHHAPIEEVRDGLDRLAVHFGIVGRRRSA